MSDHVYYNFNIINTSPTQSILAQKTDIRDDAIIKNPSEYYLSVIRFRVPTSEIPIFIAEIQPPPNVNPNNTVYSVTLAYGATAIQTYIQWIPESNLTAPANFYPPNSITNYPYYSVFSYNNFIQLVNTAFQTSFLALQKAVAPALATANAPFLLFDSYTSLFSITAQTQFYDEATASPYVQVFMNQKLFRLFASFASIEMFPSPAPNGEDFRIRINSGWGTIISNEARFNPPTGAPALRMFQDYSTVYLWSIFANLLLTTSSIPVQNEYIPEKFETSVQSGFRPIMTDFTFNISVATDNRTYAIYIPTSEYRLINLRNNIPLNVLDIVIYWQDNLNNIYPLYIGINESAQIKLLFRKKNWQNIKNIM